MDKNELFERWIKAIDIPLMAWQKEVLRIACTEPDKKLYISMPRNYGRFVVLKLVEQFEQMIKGETMESKNLTKKHRFLVDSYKDGEWDTVAKFDKHYYQKDFDGTAYLSGPVVDRLHEFEKLGYEPEELKPLVESDKQKKEDLKRAVNSIYGTRVFTEPMKVLVTTVPKEESVVLKKMRERQKEFEEFEKKVKAAICDEYRIPQSILFPPGLRDVNIVDEWSQSPSAHAVKWGEIVRKGFDDGMKAHIEVKKEKKQDMLKIERVIFNNPATIVFWADGDKTVVKCQNGEPYDPEKGLAMAISKKALGNGNKWYNEFKKQLENYEEPKLEIKLDFDCEDAIKKMRESAQKATVSFNDMAEAMTKSFNKRRGLT